MLVPMTLARIVIVDSEDEKMSMIVLSEVDGERVVYQNDDNGPITIQGTFRAPSAVEFDRAGRVITTTFKID